MPIDLAHHQHPDPSSGQLNPQLPKRANADWLLFAILLVTACFWGALWNSQTTDAGEITSDPLPVCSTAVKAIEPTTFVSIETDQLAQDGSIIAQTPPAPRSNSVDASNSSTVPRASQQRTGFFITVPANLNPDDIDRIIKQLESLKKLGSDGKRTTVILHYASGRIPSRTRLSTKATTVGNEPGNDLTRFEDALKLARYLSNPKQRRLKIIAWIDRPVSNHALLPILAAESSLCSKEGKLIGFDADDLEVEAPDKTVRLSYLEIAKQRGVFPQPMVRAFLDSKTKLSLASTISEGQQLLCGEDLEGVRAEGQIISESIWSESGTPLRLESAKLRSSNASSQIVDNKLEVADFLDLAKTEAIEPETSEIERVARYLQISGAISSSRIARWQSNLRATLKDTTVNTWLISIDSDGGSPADSLVFSDWLVEPPSPIQSVAGIVTKKASGDATLIALACKPLYLASDAVLGGPGTQTTLIDSLNASDKILIASLAQKTGRSDGLIRGLLDPSLTIYSFTNRKTGAIVYCNESDLIRSLGLIEMDAGEKDREREKWIRGDRVQLQNGITARQAIELGLADGIAETPTSAATKIGIKEELRPVTDQNFVRVIEKLGGNQAFAVVLLFIGFAALSAEFSSPGLGVPGFLSLLCFSLYFWIKLLAGTAEWFELILFTLGIICIGIEFFVIPGFGIFGIGGFLLTGLAIVLMSQTFVIPRNTYQLNAFSHGVWVMLGGFAGLLTGLILMRTLLSRIPGFRGLVMDSPDLVALNDAERIENYDHLLGADGVATTPLHPSGKAKFGEETVQVVSEGIAIESGTRLKVIQVFANRVIVEQTLE